MWINYKFLKGNFAQILCDIHCYGVTLQPVYNLLGLIECLKLVYISIM